MRRKKLIICISAIFILIIGIVIAVFKNSDSKPKRIEEESTTNHQFQSNLSNEIISEIEASDAKNVKTDSYSNQDSNAENTVDKIQETKLFGKLVEKPIIENGKRLGTYAEVVLNNKAKFTDKNIIEFYEDTVRNANYKWVTLRISKDKGIQFNKGSHIFSYGILNNNGQVTDVLGSGNVMLDKIEYQSKEK